MALLNENGGQAHRGSGIAPDRLGNNVFRLQHGAYAAYGFHLIGIGDDHDILQRNHLAKALNRLHEQGLIAHDGE